MQLHEIKSDNRKYKKPRVGRGGKRGTTSGKGQKGQKSRSGRRIRPAERDLIQRLPKLRGSNNKSIKNKPLIINVKDLDKLKKLSVFSNIKIKVLGGGEIKKPLPESEYFDGVLMSKKAKEKIENAK